MGTGSGVCPIAKALLISKAKRSPHRAPFWNTTALLRYRVVPRVCWIRLEATQPSNATIPKPAKTIENQGCQTKTVGFAFTKLAKLIPKTASKTARESQL